MCTLTFIPNETHTIFTSNRDESKERAKAFFPKLMRFKNLQVMFPKDPDQGGTWIAAGNDGRVICLMNGAFQPHQTNPPYRKSRGLVVLASFEYSSFDDFIRQINLQQIEPFTLIMWEPNNPQMQLKELRWDGQQKHFQQHNPYRPQIWSSTQLYPQRVQKKRQQWFEDWLKENTVRDLEAIRHFHHYGGEANAEENLRMTKYQEVETLSITSVEIGTDQLQMVHEDLESEDIQADALRLI